MRYYLLTLGCAKNVADSDGMGAILERADIHKTENANDADVLIINTCGFLQASRHESLDALRDLGEQKRDGQLLIAAGCLTQRYGAEVARQVPGIDGILGTRRWMDIVDVVETLRKGGLVREEDAQLENYVTKKALDGLYLMIAEEEKAIRKDPLGAAGSLEQKVFGALK